MPDKPTSGDSEQREEQTRVAREQSGLAPETSQADEEDAKRVQPDRPPRRGDTADRRG